METVISWFSYIWQDFGELLLEGIRDTLWMTGVSTLAAYLIGLPLGILARATAPDGIHPMNKLNRVLGAVINLGRSIPFIILLVAIMPLTRLIVGTTIGPVAVTVPLVLAAAPFIARLVENSLSELDKGVIEAAKAMGARDMQIIWKVMLPETVPSLAAGISMAAITIVGYTAMAGAVGGGGLGDIAIRYGYYRYETDIAVVTVVLLVAIVQIIQSIGQFTARKLDRTGTVSVGKCIVRSAYVKKKK